MKKFILIISALSGFCLQLNASSTSSGKDPVPYLSFPWSARSLAMGQSAIGVYPTDGAGAEKNPAALGFLGAQSIVATQGNFGLDRKFSYFSYDLPFYWVRHGGVHLYPSAAKDHLSEDSLFTVAEDWGDSNNRDPRSRWLIPREAKRMVVGLGYESYGISDIQSRTEFGVPTGSYSDKESAILIGFALNPYENLSMGLTAKLLSQKLEASSANGRVFDLGFQYRATKPGWSQFLWGLSGQNLGGKYEWEVSDPVLDYNFKFKKSIQKKYGFGFSFIPQQKRNLLLAADVEKIQDESARIHLGTEWMVAKGVAIRAGANSSKPTAGIGFEKALKSVNVAFHYAFQYDPDSLSNLNLFTVTCKWTVENHSDEFAIPKKTLATPKIKPSIKKKAAVEPAPDPNFEDAPAVEKPAVTQSTVATETKPVVKSKSPAGTKPTIKKKTLNSLPKKHRYSIN